MHAYKNLMSPLKVGAVTLKNRLAVAPLGSPKLLAGPKGEYNDNAIEYLIERAKGGFGLIVLGNVVGDMEADKPNVVDGQIPPAYAPGTWKESATRLTERIHVYGCKIFMQIGMGRGRMRASEKAPSRLPKYNNPDEFTEVLTKEEIETKIKWTIKTAEMAKAAGFDGVEIHAMHWGYLLDQFAMAITNHRTDEYGGETLEERLTCARKIVEGIKAACGKDFPVSMRLGMKSYMKGFNQPSLDGSEEAGRTIEETCKVGQLLEQYGYDMLNCNSGVYDAFYYCAPPAYLPKGYNLHLAKQLKEAVNIPVFCAGRNDDPKLTEKAIAEGVCDGISLGRPSLADPHYAKKLEMGCPEKIRPCISCENCMATSFTKGSSTCAVNPAAMKEGMYPLIRALQPKKIAVIGGGIGGMETARAAAVRGHMVDLYERDDVLGGRLFDAGVHSFKESIRELNAWYRLQMKELNVNVHLGTGMTAEKIRGLDADAVVLSVGSEPLMPRAIRGIDTPKAVSCVDVLTGKRQVGEKVVIVGGGLVGAEMAYDYGLEGKKVVLVEALDSLMSNDPNGIPYWVRDMLIELLDRVHCDVRTGCKLECINEKGAVITEKDGAATEIEADQVIMAIGFRARPSMARELYGCGKEIYEITVGNGIGNIATQVSSAYEIARKL